MTIDKFDKDFDLEPTEYRKAETPEPFFGFNAKPVLFLFLASFPISAAATWLVTGRFPYWLQHFLE